MQALGGTVQVTSLLIALICQFRYVSQPPRGFAKAQKAGEQKLAANLSRRLYDEVGHKKGCPCIAEDIELAVSGVKGQQHMDDVIAERSLHRIDLALSSEYKQPQTEAQRRLVAIWQDAFRMDVVGVLDDFFELGGDLFTATTLAAEIEVAFDTRFTPADIITLSTVAQQAEVLTNARGSIRELPACLVLGRAGGPKSPLFMVHGGKGFAFFAPVFLDIVGEERSVYLFQAPGLDGRLTPLEKIDQSTTVEEIAKQYVEAMQSIQPSGPYYLAGMCAGSFIALEMCHQLETAGQSIERLVLLDPTPAPPRTRAPVKREKQHPEGASDQGFGARLWRFLFSGRKSEVGLEQLDLVEMPPKMKENLRGKIKRRIEQMTHVPTEQRSYTAERMFKVSEQLRAALYKHEPRPYPGRAVLLMCSLRAQEGITDNGFWPTHLGSMQYEVLGTKHRDIFSEHLAETARFVREALN